MVAQAVEHSASDLKDPGSNPRGNLINKNLAYVIDVNKVSSLSRSQIKQQRRLECSSRASGSLAQ